QTIGGREKLAPRNPTRCRVAGGGSLIAGNEGNDGNELGRYGAGQRAAERGRVGCVEAGVSAQQPVWQPGLATRGRATPWSPSNLAPARPASKGRLKLSRVPFSLPFSLRR